MHCASSFSTAALNVAKTSPAIRNVRKNSSSHWELVVSRVATYFIELKAAVLPSPTIWALARSIYATTSFDAAVAVPGEIYSRAMNSLPHTKESRRADETCQNSCRKRFSAYYPRRRIAFEAEQLHDLLVSA